MKERDRIGFRRIIRDHLAAGKTLTQAIEAAHAWLLKPGKVAHPTKGPTS